MFSELRRRRPCVNDLINRLVQMFSDLQQTMMTRFEPKAPRLKTRMPTAWTKKDQDRLAR